MSDDLENRYEELIEKGVQNLNDQESAELTDIQKKRLKLGRYLSPSEHDANITRMNIAEKGEEE